MVTINTLPVTSVKGLNFWWIICMLGLVDSFSDEWLAFIVPLLADLFLYSYENEFLDKLIKEGKKKNLLESSIYHAVILMTLSLSIIKDLRSSFLIFTPKNSQFLKPQNLLQLLSISIYFSSEIKATI